MSPSEEQLRRALRDGEQSTSALDPDRIIGAARRDRHERRVRLAAVAASVAAVAVVGGGVVALTGRDRHTTSAGPGRSTAASSAAGPSTAAVAPKTGDSAGDGGSTATASAPPCPTVLPALTPPSGGTAADPLLPDDPKQIIACLYISTAGGPNAAYSDSALLLGQPAAALAASVNQASVHPLPTMCPAIAKNYSVDLALLARSASGAAVPVVEASVSAIAGCNQPITNGVGRRYGWAPPASLQAVVQAATQQAQARSRPGGSSSPTAPQRTPIIIGTPAR